ncbi:hypothetical protein [Nocardioides bizhenqiangii]|uniref:DUF397 domain-containing protein n=1 Tax=Nocardioides bizhenqiangii TaxID=3095076 RepID=A0ABZ0ZSZ8_9ACTN|nr:hypothetical protein [Nocardioides sp. HM61]WQQ27327.1 hypothetical protein SHK19_03650 [Nocardioides sp. HM61]
MGTYRTFIDANRSAVRASGAAHKCPELGGSGLDLRARRTDGQELPLTLESPVE